MGPVVLHQTGPGQGCGPRSFTSDQTRSGVWVGAVVIIRPGQVRGVGTIVLHQARPGQGCGLGL